MFMPSKRLISENVPCTCKIKKKKRSELLLLCGIDCTNKPWQKKNSDMKFKVCRCFHKAVEDTC